MEETKKKKRAPVKWTIELIKIECEKNGFELVSTEYINARTKLDIICSCGRPNSTLIQSIRNGMTCSTCGGERAGKKSMHSYEFVKSFFEKNGCKLLSPEYRKNSERLDYICVCGEESKISFAHFQNGKRCKDCAGNKPLTIEEVRARFEDFGLELLTTEYQNADQIFEYMCNCGEVGTISQYGLREDLHCQECHFNKLSEDRRHDIEFIRQEFLDGGCILIEDEYINNSIPLKYQCSCGNFSVISYGSFQRGSRCEDCRWKKFSKSRKIPFKHLLELYESSGCQLLSEEYISTHHPLTFRCHCGEEDTKTLRSFRKNSCCTKCARPKRTALIPEEERIKTRQIDGYSEWRFSVLERDGFMCVCCESEDSLIAHHMDGYAWCAERRVDVTNGQTMCNIHHRMFHSIYGIKNNTEQQFDEFMTIYNAGKILDVLTSRLEKKGVIK